MYQRDQWGNEVDENGYLRAAVEGWAEHGIYPPPMVGNPNNPQVVAMAKAHRAKIAQLSAEEQEQQFEGERQLMREFWAGFGVVPPTRVSSSS